MTFRLYAIAGAAAGLLGPMAAMPVHAQSSSVVIYGRLNVGLERAQLRGAATSNVLRESNYRSVLGFRGEEDLGGGMKALFQIEGAVSLDTGGGAIASRDTRLGIAGALGTLFAGDWTLPYTSATSAFDPFYPTTAGYMGIMGNGSAPNATNVSDTSSFDRRQANQVQYASAPWKGLSTRWAYGLNEETVAETGAKPSLFSASVSYEVSGWTLVAAHERHHEYQTAHTDDMATKVGLSYAEGPLKVATVLERLQYRTGTGDLTRNAWYVSGIYRVGSGTVRAGYARAGNGGGTATETVGFFHSGPHTGASQFTVGYEHELSKRTAIYTFYSRVDNASDAIYDFAINELGAAPGEHPSVLSVGMRHSF
jgi:predicted porin